MNTECPERVSPPQRRQMRAADQDVGKQPIKIQSKNKPSEDHSSVLLLTERLGYFKNAKDKTFSIYQILLFQSSSPGS